jgi:hypothetical protein
VKGLTWGGVIGVAIGIGVVAFHRPWPDRLIDVWRQVAGWAFGGCVVGPIILAQVWANVIGEYARTGTVPPPPPRWLPGQRESDK